MIDDTPFAVEETAMKYVKVESSQIAEIGYGDGVYGPHTLGLKFPPNKKQIAAGEAGSEYHYKNITPEMHEEFLNAESIGSYFGKNIKGRPDLHPFTKIEAELPVRKSTFIPADKVKEFAEDAPRIDFEIGESTSTALAIIDTTEDELLFTPGKITDAQLAAGREWYLTEARKYDIATEKQRTELKRFARPLQKLRTGIEARAKELTGATKRKIAAIDAEKRRLVQIVGGIEDEVLAPLTAWEREEEERKTRLAGIVKSLGEHVVNAIYPTIASLEETIAELESFDVSTMQEYRVGAESAIAASLKVLKPELERRKIAEANEAELAKLRAEAAERAEKDRLAEAARLAREAAEREARESVARAERERLEAVERAEKAEADKLAAVEAERKRQEAEAARVKSEAEARAADEKHRNQVNYEAASALASECNLDEPLAHEIVQAIAKGLIPHVSVNY